MKALKNLTLATVFALGSLAGFANTELNANTVNLENENTLEEFVDYGPYVCGRHYSVQGTSTIETRFQTVYNAYAGCYVQVRYMRQLNWYQQSETIYGAYGPYTSYYWVCTWGPWVQG